MNTNERRILRRTLTAAAALGVLGTAAYQGVRMLGEQIDRRIETETATRVHFAKQRGFREAVCGAEELGMLESEERPVPVGGHARADLAERIEATRRECGTG